jgi:hypothetical protein
MPSPAEAFAQALETERQAAVHADFEALLQVQEEKRVLLPLLQESATPEVARELAEQARKNLGLLRQLVACMRGYLEIDHEPTYTARGEPLQSAPGGLRGRL